ncbi:MAG: DnaJ domain-containing protein, partial [Deltaproteobacteria bacterium]|nr:DnaJ domain-containing protein [Deltaproteobacteria bacterium]
VTTPRAPAVPRTLTSPSQPRTVTPPIPSRTNTADLEHRPTRDFVRDPRTSTREAPAFLDEPRAEFEAARQRTITAEPLGPSSLPAVARTRSSPSIPRTSTPRNIAQVKETIAWGMDLLAKRAEHFAFFGLTRSATLDSIRSAYVALTNQLHPDKIPALDDAMLEHGSRLFNHVTAAFAVLSDPVRRNEYVASLPAEEPQLLFERAQPAPESPAEKARLAAEAHKKGLAALKRDDVMMALDELGRAVTLMPADVDYHAALAWARFCASSDRRAIAPETRKALDRAIHRSPKPAVARFYLGRVERMLGRIEQALEHFQEVIELDPGNTEAATEIRMLAPRASTKR